MEFISRCDLCETSDGLSQIVCETPRADPTLSQLGVTQPYTTLLCTKCGWVFKPGILSRDQLGQLYDRVGGRATTEPAAAVAIRNRARELYDFMDQHVDLSSKKNELSILDVGGGVGQVSSTFAERGHDVHVLDVAVAVEGCDPSGAITYHRSDLADFAPPKLFDLILMNHILEHVWSPSDALHIARQLLTSQGRIYIEVPFELYTALVKRKLGDPCHVGYFSTKTLRGFLTKCGFDVCLCGRTMGRYNGRNVMILRALAQSRSAIVSDATAEIPDGWMHTVFDMIHPHQLALAMRRTRNLPARLQSA